MIHSKDTFYITVCYTHTPHTTLPAYMSIEDHSWSSLLTEQPSFSVSLDARSGQKREQWEVSNMQLLLTAHLPERIACSHQTTTRTGSRKSWKSLANHTNNYNLLFFDTPSRMLQNRIVGVLETFVHCLCWKYLFSL